MKNFFKIIALAKNYKPSLWLNVFFNIFAIVFGLFSFVLFLPFLRVLMNTDELKEIATKGQPEALKFTMDSLKENAYYLMSNFLTTHSKMELLLLLCGVILGMIFMKNISRYLALFFMAGVRNGIVKDYRNKIYSKILALPLSYFSDERKGDIISKMTNDVKEIEWSVLRSLEAVYRDPIAITITISWLIFMSPSLSLFILLLIPIVVIIALITRKLRKASANSQELIGDMISTTEETLSGLKIIKGFNGEQIKKEDFEEENERYTSQMTKMFRRIDMASPLSEFLGVSVIIATMLYGGSLVFSGKMTGEELITYLGIFYTVIAPAKSLTDAVSNAQRGIASMNRINEILDADNIIHDPKNPIEVKELTEKIEFNHLNFKYQDDYVIKDVSFSIPKGKSVALVGQSGSGKSTIANLLPRFYDLEEGEITIDGNNIKDISIKNLRNLMGVVTQDAILFNDTIANNISFGMENSSADKIMEAAKIANAHDFILQLPNGYETNIGDGGGKLSGGQKQRISIARAVLKNPDILVLDEATSALDTESEKLVQDALNNLMRNRTSLIIAHRLSTIQHADEIIVMQDGKIMERGTHEELINQKGIYTKLTDMQSFV
ncbi:MAG: subfamily B ATP-binding cassette protein MsbA [Flavobacteriales bacterium]|jgi:subfamily B ATP-binding cassette protein MsbA|tara:strand:- start:12476 stop:14302 length:1827 start_codon:yes stop_codon:yes gene_type:complete